MPPPSVDIYARLYNAAGTAATSEFIVNTDNNVAPARRWRPVRTAGSCWRGRNTNPRRAHQWLGYLCATLHQRRGGRTSLVVNSYMYGDQYIPRLKCHRLGLSVAWTSLGQDGSREGVYGQFVHNSGAPGGRRVPRQHHHLGQQMQPDRGLRRLSQFLAVWTSFGAPTASICSRSVTQTWPRSCPDAVPYVWAPFVVSNGVYQPELVVAWAPSRARGDQLRSLRGWRESPATVMPESSGP